VITQFTTIRVTSPRPPVVKRVVPSRFEV
jgi:hypothetical protein